MEGIKDYQEYEQLFKDDLVVAVRKLLKRIEDNKERNDLEDSLEHNILKDYFNKFALHKKIDRKRFDTWR